MKKKILILLLSTFLSSSIFATWFGNRIFEVVLDVPVGVSNNTFAVLDYLKKDLVIDLQELSKKMPESGFNVSMYANPSVAINIYPRFFDLGFKAGADVYGQAGISKDLFDYICNGNELGQDLNVEAKVYGDVFAYTQVNLGLSFGKFLVNVTPAVFVPVLHVFSNDTKIILSNPSEGEYAGNIIFDMSGSANLYSNYNLQDTDKLVENLMKSIGFDLAGSVNYDLFKKLNIGVSTRIPIVPGHFYYLKKQGFSMRYRTSINMLLSGETASDNQPFIPSDSTWESIDYYINRPLKLNLNATFKPFREFLVVKASGGLGVNCPFAQNKEEITFYPEYLAGIGINVFDVFKLDFTTSYENQIFIHQLGMTLNVRLLELDVGVSTQAANFTSSFRLAGVGAYVSVIIGF